jgi:hypothetical protein
MMMMVELMVLDQYLTLQPPDQILIASIVELHIRRHRLLVTCHVHLARVLIVLLIRHAMPTPHVLPMINSSLPIHRIKKKAKTIL